MNPSEHVHFIGIGGYGMSAIAKVMLEMGYRVSGSDLAQNELTDKLKAKGARVFIGNEAGNVQGADLVVYSTAVSKDDVEIREAEQRGIPILHRSQMLARLMNERKGVAVAGAHGKTTTSSMIALVMETCGMDPTFIIGGEIMNVGSNAKAGQGDYVVAEADESDGTFLQYHPLLAIVNNIEADHLENYNGDFDNLKRAYAQFLSQVREEGKAIVCKDDVHLREMMPAIRSEVVTYGIESDDADFVATDIRLGDRKVEFTVRRRGGAGSAAGAGSSAGAGVDVSNAVAGEVLGPISLSVPGKHNVYNALATLITCLEAGLTFEQVAGAITDFRGAKRRFQVIGEVDDILVIDDYAHHPTEIQATIAAAKATGKRIIAVFQPQRYTRTYYLLEQFSRAFQEADEVIITDIYSPAGERQIEGVNSAKLVELIRQNSNERVTYIPTRDEVQQFLSGHVKSGDLVLTMGAGDIWKAADGLAKQLRSKTS